MVDRIDPRRQAVTALVPFRIAFPRRDSPDEREPSLPRVFSLRVRRRVWFVIAPLMDLDISDVIGGRRRTSRGRASSACDLAASVAIADG
ncbi:hypothetical protein D3C83_24790 [compost metagenome]